MSPSSVKIAPRLFRIPAIFGELDRYDSILKGFMAWYGEKLETKIKVPYTLPDYIEDSDIEKLKEAMRSKRTHKKVIERNILIIDLATKTGLRRAEIADLRVADINQAQRYLTVRMGKGMKDRIVDLTPSLTLSLEAFIKGKAPEDIVFGLKATTISGLIHWAAVKARVNIHTHSLRHFFGEKLVDTGTDMEIVRRLMGHSSLSTTQRYIGRTDKQRRDAIDRMEKQDNKDHETDDAKRKALEMEKLEREVMQLRLEQAKL